MIAFTLFRNELHLVLSVSQHSLAQCIYPSLNSRSCDQDDLRRGSAGQSGSSGNPSRAKTEKRKELRSVRRRWLRWGSATSGRRHWHLVLTAALGPTGLTFEIDEGGLLECFTQITIRGRNGEYG
jgi:hypothetical protein